MVGVADLLTSPGSGIGNNVRQPPLYVEREARSAGRPWRPSVTLPRVASSDDQRVETDYERSDRNLSELLQELRVILPGVQVLFAFLFTAPFAPRLRASSFGPSRSERRPRRKS